jgi:hypothetical protein
MTADNPTPQPQQDDERLQLVDLLDKYVEHYHSGERNHSLGMRLEAREDVIKAVFALKHKWMLESRLEEVYHIKNVLVADTQTGFRDNGISLAILDDRLTVLLAELQKQLTNLEKES